MGAAALISGEVGFEGAADAIDTPAAPDDHVKVLVRPESRGPGVRPPRSVPGG
ncbi:hypothetical protein [Streptomyces sp. NPDC053427]|uniref:hypothetical protein n=1 Tax=Streptomyces sp. NPDC053427 TaxID=3365701 RepID=UPI0037CF9E95